MNDTAEMEFSPDGQVLGVVSEDGTLKLIDVNTTK
jgi:WD40 repeat protein